MATQILFHDVDGCLNAPDGDALPMRGEPLTQVQQRALGALGDQLSRSDIDIVCINTGRALADTVSIADAITNTAGEPLVDYIISEHGAVVFDTNTQSTIDVWQSASNPFEAIQRLLVWYRDTGLAQIEQQFGTSLELLDKDANLTLAIPESLEYAPMAAFIEKQLQAEFPQEASSFVFHHSVADRFLDVMPPINKGDGVRALTDWLVTARQITQVTTTAVGNGSNDLPLFAAVDQFVCPSNSEDSVQAYCATHGGYAASNAYIEASMEWLER